MVGNFLAGGAAVNTLARQAGVAVTVVDVGVLADLPTAPIGGSSAPRRSPPRRSRSAGGSRARA
jgi:NaMN:DMB phosphoribosyltransferase